MSEGLTQDKSFTQTIENLESNLITLVDQLRSKTSILPEAYINRLQSMLAKTQQALDICLRESLQCIDNATPPAVILPLCVSTTCYEDDVSQSPKVSDMDLSSSDREIDATTV